MKMLQMSVTVEKGLKYVVLLPLPKLAINLYKIPLNVTLNNCSNTCSTLQKQQQRLIVSHLLLQQRFVLMTTIRSCGSEWGRHLEFITVQMPVCTL